MKEAGLDSRVLNSPLDAVELLLLPQNVITLDLGVVHSGERASPTLDSFHLDAGAKPEAKPEYCCCEPVHTGQRLVRYWGGHMCYRVTLYSQLRRGASQ